MKALLNLTVGIGIFTGSTPAVAEVSSTIKLVRCSYQLGEKETLEKAVAELVSSEPSFPLRTLGDDGWVAVTRRLKTNEKLESQLKVSQKFDLLVPEHRLHLKKDQMTECNEVFYLIGSKIKPTAATIAHLTTEEPFAKLLTEADISADFLAHLPTMPPVMRNETWYFLMQYKKMVKEVRPIVEPGATDFFK